MEDNLLKRCSHERVSRSHPQLTILNNGPAGVLSGTVGTCSFVSVLVAVQDGATRQLLGNG
jgi:hypothetical protein